MCLCQLPERREFRFSYQSEKATNQQPTLSRRPSQRALAWVTQPTSGRVPHCHNFTQSCPPHPIGTCRLPLEGHHGRGRGERLLRAKCEPRGEQPSTWPFRPRFCWMQANLWFWCSLSALHSKGALISAVCFCTGEAKYFYYLFYYLSYELLLFA